MTHMTNAFNPHNPLLQHSDLPLFDQIKPEHVNEAF
jgi:Zn-dependent oligopeptidase